MATKSKRRTANSTSTQRLKQDYMRLVRDPVPYIVAAPKMDNILEWHYVVTGPENSPYEGGYYHGKLVFPADYPFKPPSIYMLTPNGRFKCNTRLCLSISDFHPDTWNPAWSVSTILTGLLSFMLEDQPTLGSISTTHEVKRVYAAQSLSFNVADKTFCELFPELTEELRKEMARKLEEEENSNGSSHPGLVTKNPSTDSSSLLNHVVLLIAIGLLAYIAHAVIKSSNEFAS